jgi:SRSO17 transposase
VARWAKANGQCAVSLHSVAPKGHYPRARRLSRPDSWRNDAGRLDRAGVPAEARRRLSKGQIALELLDQARGEGLPGQIVVADAGAGVSGPFRDGLEQRGLPDLVGVTAEMVVFTAEPRWIAPQAATGGRPPTRPRLADDSPRPVSLKDWAERTPRWKGTWRAGAQGKLGARFAWLRVGPASGWETGRCACAQPIWLLIEEQADGKLKLIQGDSTPCPPLSQILLRP